MQIAININSTNRKFKKTLLPLKVATPTQQLINTSGLMTAEFNSKSAGISSPVPSQQQEINKSFINFYSKIDEALLQGSQLPLSHSSLHLKTQTEERANSQPA